MLSPQFHKILGAAFFLLPCCAQGKPSGIPPLPGFTHLPEDGKYEGFIPGFLPPSDNEMEDIICHLKHRISRLKEVIYLPLLSPVAGLVGINKMSNKMAILFFVKSFNTYAYLGIKESLIPNKFQFLDGTQLNYTNWYLNEPSQKGEEECVEIYTDGTWNDKRCHQHRLIVCQF
ncbi:SFTPA protein, partial [Ardeotis kori]|nr:SFTPA protein [Ardeotis kori]